MALGSTDLSESSSVVKWKGSTGGVILWHDAESWNRSLLDNGSLGTFPQQRIGLWKPGPPRSYKGGTRNWFSIRRPREEAGSHTSTVALQVVGEDKKGNLESETENMVASPTGLRPENKCTGEGQQQLNDRPILSSERMLYKDYDHRCSIEKISNRKSQGACHQDELIGGKPSVVK
jgi:hypothetical protein